MDSFSSTPNLQIGTSRASAGAGLYYLQIRPNSSGVSGPMECVPLHLIINDLDNGNEQYLESVPSKLNKDLQLCVDAVPDITNAFCKEIVYRETTEFKNTSQLNLPDKALSSSTNSKQSVPKIDTEPFQKNVNKKNCDNQSENSFTFKKETQQIQSFVHIPDRTVPQRAIAVLPTALQFRRELISPRRLLPAHVRFGPLQGVKHEKSPAEVEKLISDAAASHSPIFLLRGENNSAIHIDVSDKDKSSWLGLLPLGDQSSANVWLYEESGEIYGVTTKSISSRTPLALGYSEKYAEEHGLSPGQPVLYLEQALPLGLKQWWCFECHCAMGSPALLEQHIDINHRDEKPPPRRRYRCSHCTRTFSRLYTLKRHVLSFCTKKVDKLDNSLNSEPLQTKRDASWQNVEDSKVPSDESLQNYTNGLDFSTNLFDTDRMPNFDISGSSREEAEFNPYAVGFKDESNLANDMGFTNRSRNKINVEASEEKMLVSCPHCDQTIVKSKKRQHLRECKARRFECGCGQVFNKKQSLEQHIHKEHSVLKSRTLKDAAKALKENELSYKCDECRVAFKRRGVLVNHLWRVHKSLSTSVPLERRVRHYPCVACPKIYRAAAKRDRHVRNHHPGTELIRSAPIEGERRACEPASCPECPRQYATRAKLLQHVRAHHPHLDIPIRKKMTLNEKIKGKQIESSSL